MDDKASNTEILMGSEKSFGLVFAALFTFVGFFPLLFGGGSIRIWALAVAGSLMLLAYFFPKFLQTPNRLWFRFGLLLNRVMSPVIMGLIFICAVIPTGLIMRALGKDLLREKMDDQATSYWLTPDSEHHRTSSMRNQF